MMILIGKDALMVEASHLSFSHRVDPQSSVQGRQRHIQPPQQMSDLSHPWRNPSSRLAVPREIFCPNQFPMHDSFLKRFLTSSGQGTHTTSGRGAARKQSQRNEFQARFLGHVCLAAAAVASKQAAAVLCSIVKDFPRAERDMFPSPTVPVMLRHADAADPTSSRDPTRRPRLKG